MAQVGDHSAGNLMAVPGLVVFARRADGQPFLLCDPTEMLFDGCPALFRSPKVYIPMPLSSVPR